LEQTEARAGAMQKHNVQSALEFPAPFSLPAAFEATYNVKAAKTNTPIKMTTATAIRTRKNLDIPTNAGQR